MSSRSSASSLTGGDLARPLLTLAWPIVVTQLRQAAYNISDTLWLGHHSAAAVGAISFAFPLAFLFISVAGEFTVLGGVLVAQYAGASSERSTGRVVGKTLVLVLALSTFVGILGYSMTEPRLELVPSQAETGRTVIPLAADYLRLFFPGLPFLFRFEVFVALMQGTGIPGCQCVSCDLAWV